MIPGSDFMLLMEAGRKLDRNQPLSAEEQRVIDTYGRFEKKLCGCGCGEPLEPRVDGERQKLGGKEVNTDCYWDSFGKELDQYPIGHLGVRRGGAI